MIATTFTQHGRIQGKGQISIDSPKRSVQLIRAVEKPFSNREQVPLRISSIMIDEVPKLIHAQPLGVVVAAVAEAVVQASPALPRAVLPE